MWLLLWFNKVFYHEGRSRTQVGQEPGGRSWCKDNGGTGLVACSACFLIQIRITEPMSEDHPHQSLTLKLSHRFAHRPTWCRQSIKLTKLTSPLCVRVCWIPVCKMSTGACAHLYEGQMSTSDISIFFLNCHPPYSLGQGLPLVTNKARLESYQTPRM